jgi:2-keto-3-deoxy-6-phosphogluconate aldolase
MEQLVFSDQIERLLTRLVENGLDFIDVPEKVEVIQEDINEAFAQAVNPPVDLEPVLKKKPVKPGKLRTPPEQYNSQVGAGGGSNVFGGLMPQVAIECAEGVKNSKMKKFSEFSCACKK